MAESEYPLGEKERFNRGFSDYIEQSVRATSEARRFHAHMMGTITYHDFANLWLLQKLRDGHPGDNVTIYMSGPLARSMEVLNIYGMVFLPMGLQPFQENVSQQPALDAMELVKTHIGDIGRRLEKDIVMINALRQSLDDLVAISAKLKFHTAQLLFDNRRSLIASQPQWWELWRHAPQNQLDRYMIEQQASWLGELRYTVGLLSELLRSLVDDFQSTIHSCRVFKEQLIRERGAAYLEWEVSDWIKKQADDLEVYFEDLRFHLQNFEKEKVRFDKDLFPP